MPVWGSASGILQNSVGFKTTLSTIPLNLFDYTLQLHVVANATIVWDSIVVGKLFFQVSMILPEEIGNTALKSSQGHTRFSCIRGAFIFFAVSEVELQRLTRANWHPDAIQAL